MGEPEQPEKVNRDLPGDHRGNGPRQVLGPAKVGKPAHDERRRHESGQVSVAGRARRDREHRKTGDAFGDVEEHRCGAEPCAQGRAAQQHRERLPGDGHRGEWKRDRDVRHQAGEQTEGEHQTGVTRQRPLGKPVPDQRG